MSTPGSLWRTLKIASHPASRQRVSRATPGKVFGALSGILTPATEQALIESGALRAMQTPSRQLRPLGIICETVNLCNSDCVFCPYSQQTRKFGTMNPELFEEVCRQYVAMGGGPMSLTPVVGDILLDKELPSRIRVLRMYRHAIQPSVTTNLYALEKHSDEVLGELLETLVRIHISVYGITSQENATITRRSNFEKFAAQARRIGDLWQRSSRRCSMWVSFRNLYDYPHDTLLRYVDANFGQPQWFQAATSRYFNWGGKMSGPLPGDAQWASPVENSKTCMLLTTALQVYWDGRVSACSCCDYDAGHDLALGNVREQTLTDIYNSAVNVKIWAEQESGNMQNICRHCTNYVPLTRLLERPTLGQGWFDFNGG